MIDEVYIKSAFLYHGGTLFGKSVNFPDKLDKTMLAHMVQCLYGGPELLTNILPICKLDAAFQLSQCAPLINCIKQQEGGEILAIIVDGNRVNQKIFKDMDTVPFKPWLRTDNMFLLFDYVHVFKCIRNNWLTEKNGELILMVDGELQALTSYNN